jgi:predicted ester cyclase
MHDTPTDSVQLVDAYADLYNERAYGRIPAVVTETFTKRTPHHEVTGTDGLEAEIRRTTDSFSDLQITSTDRVTNGDVVMEDATFTGTNDGRFRGLPPTDREVEVRMLSKFRTEDDRIADHVVVFDQQTLFEQLGLLRR